MLYINSFKTAYSGNKSNYGNDKNNLHFVEVFFGRIRALLRSVQNHFFPYLLINNKPKHK